MATSRIFGTSTPGATFMPLTAGRKYATVFNLPESGTVSKISVYLAGGGSAQAVRGFIFSDNERTPQVRKAQSAEVVVTGGGAAWVDFVFPAPVALSAGDYWLGLIAGGTSGQIIVYYTVNAQAVLRSNADGYSDGADDPWGTATLVDAAKLSVFATYALTDSIAPTCTLTSPLPGATVTGTVTVTATAADDVAVAGVQFYVDGLVLGGEDVLAPFAVSWDTTAFEDGSHQVKAVARDAAGNTTASDTAVVTVANIADTVAPVGDVAIIENL